MKRQQWIFLAFLLILATALGGSVGAGLTLYLADEVSEAPSETLVYEVSEFTDVWEAASPAVVSVVALKELSQRYSQFSTGSGTLTEVSSGTAFIISPDGLALTNKHVVADTAAEYVVILEDGTELSAEVLDRDSLNDIAILKITDEDPRTGSLPYLELADSEAIRVGDPVLAIGNALGEYANTTTAGIVSATGRDIVAAGGFGATESLVGLIQTDAAINPGNSGGPLINLSGQVIGMNSAIDSTAAGIGFAIPSNDLQLVLDSYYEYGEIVRPFLGVRFVMINPSLQQRFQLPYEEGALLIADESAGIEAVLSDSPASMAGLQSMDVILSIDGVAINQSYSIPNALASHQVGDTVVLEIGRNGETFKVSVQLSRQEA